MNKLDILGSHISTGSYHTFVEEIVGKGKRNESSYVCVANVHMVMEAHKDGAFRKVLNEADITTPDGMPLVKGMKMLYNYEQDRVAGMDLMPSLMKEAEALSLSVYFYGSTEEVLSKITDRAGKEFPSLHIAGTYSPPFRKLSPEEEAGVIDMINEAAPHLVFVALGCPKQEKWMANHLGKIHACMLGVGGAFPVYAGEQSRAPMWMQKMALEWMYRLVLEPNRLWKRYMVTNSAFVFHFIKRWVGLKMGLSSRTSPTT
ncbi:MAG: WecB/TagA/CpsF family glycosyltransferase [Bacteroidota bacterium]